ncbi:protein FAM166A-like [Bombina bombina]|uniref:protein FAM166A-like n=1 Tax=Bombina bombina TaxID=8345 RepID=UPI00235ACB61|nr:protein FAM166A-like [Bombina bombina]
MNRSQNITLMSLEPYYLPGYTGFCPQLSSHVGKTYGRATNDVLTDLYAARTSSYRLSPITKATVQKSYVDPKATSARMSRTPQQKELQRFTIYKPEYDDQLTTKLSTRQQVTTCDRTAQTSLENVSYISSSKVQENQIKKVNYENDTMENLSPHTFVKPASKPDSHLPKSFKPDKKEILSKPKQRRVIPGHMRYQDGPKINK